MFLLVFSLQAPEDGLKVSLGYMHLSAVCKDCRLPSHTCHTLVVRGGFTLRCWQILISFSAFLWFARLACGTLMYWLRRSLCLLSLFAVNDYRSFCVYFLTEWAIGTELRTRRTATVLTYTDVGTLGLPARQTSSLRPRRKSRIFSIVFLSF